MFKIGSPLVGAESPIRLFLLFNYLFVNLVYVREDEINSIIIIIITVMKNEI